MVPVDGGPANHWADPRLLFLPPAFLGVLVLVRVLRRSASRPRRRTSYVLKIRAADGSRQTGPQPARTESAGSRIDSAELLPAPRAGDCFLANAGDLPLVPAETPAAEDPPPAAGADPETAGDETPAARARDELNALDGAERMRILDALDATRRLAEWVASVLPVFREIEEARGGVRFESLSLAARREWIDAYDTLRRFAESLPSDLPLSQEEPAILGLCPPPDAYEPELSLRDRLRRRLLAHDGSGLVHRVVLALQYLLEAFPVEQLDADARAAYKAALRERLLATGVSPRLHDLVRDLAAGLGLAYREVRCYKSAVGQAGFEFLDDAHDELSLSALVGYEAGTAGPTVVRLKELFLVDAATGAPFSGRAAVDRASRGSTPGRS